VQIVVAKFQQITVLHFQPARGLAPALAKHAAPLMDTPDIAMGFDIGYRFSHDLIPDRVGDFATVKLFSSEGVYGVGSASGVAGPRGANAVRAGALCGAQTACMSFGCTLHHSLSSCAWCACSRVRRPPHVRLTSDRLTWQPHAILQALVKLLAAAGATRAIEIDREPLRHAAQHALWRLGRGPWLTQRLPRPRRRPARLLRDRALLRHTAARGRAPLLTMLHVLFGDIRRRYGPA
jgi:hypothetical protein